MLKKLSYGVGFLAFAFILFVLFKTLTFSHEPRSVEAINRIEVPAIAVDRFRESIKFETVSHLNKEDRDTTEFIAFNNFISESYPLVDSLLERSAFNYSVLLKWEGKNPANKAIVMMGHFDVVPVDESTLEEWEAPPFSGELKDGKIFGRGTMDDKINVIAALETVELLLSQGFQPESTIYFSFGHDEEVGGPEGAGLIAEHLKNEEVAISFVIDEGGFIAEGMIDGIDKKMAIINVAEKGYVSYNLTLRTSGGHSSQPPTDNTIGSLARAIVALEDNQFGYKMLPVLEEQISIIGPQFNDFTKRMAFANPWLFGDVILEPMNAHTTTAPTMLDGGVKDNVIPTEASVVVNFRIMPGQSAEEVYEHIVQTVNDDRISIEAISEINEPSDVSATDSDSYELIEKTILQLFPETIVSPGLLGGGTDSKHFIPVADNVYRFYPTRITKQNMSCFHGNNEHISVDNFIETIQFNYQLIKNLK